MSTPAPALAALPAPLATQAETRRYTVAVRALCEFTAKAGDLDLRFTPSATALEGQAGHVTVAFRRGEAYEAELSLAGEHGALQVRGRADGYDPARNRLEEVKTYRGDLSAMPANRRALHWAQAKVYGALLCRERGLAELEVALVYFDVSTQQETLLVEHHPAAALEAFFIALCERFVAWAEHELAHRAARDAALAELSFAHADFRPGQRVLSEAVYRATVGGRRLLAQAPTGIGKTIGTLFPVLKAWPGQRLDKLFFLTAKTPGRALALEALHTLDRHHGSLPLRVLEMVARDKACEHLDKACHGDSCPLARGFFDRLPAARAAALDTRRLDKPTLRQVALAHEVCPYHLGQELVRWADVVVGDYNHCFDTSALLHGMTLADGWRTALLVDEAHNLVERARAMYSGELRLSALQALRGTAPVPLQASLGRLARAWAQLDAEQPAAYAVLDDLPEAWRSALQAFLAAMGDHLAEQAQATTAGDSELLRFYFDALHLARLHDGYGSHSMLDLTHEAGDSLLNLRNVVPAPHLLPRWAAAHSVTLFSATLQPTAFHQDLLGLSEHTLSIDVPSPFGPEQLRVQLADEVSTRWDDRAASIAPIATLIATQYQAAPGNYLAFFSSFDYLQQAADALAEAQPSIPQWRQSRAMNESAREAFLARFTSDGRGIGFAVLGGAFGEGIDLPGRRLVGAFIATLGMPPWNPVNEAFKARMDGLFGEDRGHDYTYLYPGLQKVVQAAGRVIRSADDRGVVWLIDDRYRRRKVRRLLPGWWGL
jgi:DNA excision repair protein ERCC-2